MSQAMTKAKRLFRRMTVREQLLALLFVIVMLSIWAVSLLERAGAWNDGRNGSRESLTEQSLWLDRAADYANEANQALERLEPSRTYDSSQLSGRIDTLLRQAGLSTKADIDPVRSQEGEIFSQHNIRVQLKRISIAELVKFNSLLRDEAPYINQQEIRISAQRGREEELNARIEIYSLELI